MNRVVGILVNDYDAEYASAVLAVKSAKDDGDYGTQLFMDMDDLTIAELINSNGDYWLA